MCGVAGLIQLEPASQSDIDAVRRMTSAQRHRGPDAEGIYCGPGVVLGHRRLSIIDLSSKAEQPMGNEDGSVQVSFNGEIYNFSELREHLKTCGHEFRTASDTEVIVHGYEEWGIAALLEKLRGMFAFAIYDRRVGLMLARDRLGIKPLYYASIGGKLLFSSEVKALMASGLVANQRDFDAIAGFLLTGSVPSPSTVIRGVRSLPAGHYLCWKSGTATLHRYWDLTYEARDGVSVEGLRERLKDCVARHMVSDVPMGLFLSGGVDSCALVVLAERLAPERLNTLTVVFEDGSLSEGSAAREIAARFRTRHREVMVTERDFRQELPRILSAMDQPTNDGVNTYFVSKAARESGLTVALSGLGGDEVFWGYRHYRMLSRGMRWLGRCPGPVRRLLAAGAVAAGRMRGKENWMRLAYLKPRLSSESLYLSVRGFFAPMQVARLLGLSETEISAAVEKAFDFGHPAGTEGVNYIEFKRYMHDQLLRDTDVFSMTHSLEVRVPFLDHEIVDYATSANASSKVAANGVNKPLLVAAVADPVVRAAAARKKLGFSFPMDRWMRGYSGELEEMSRGAGGMDSAEVRAMWKGFRAGRLHWSRAWALAVLGRVN